MPSTSSLGLDNADPRKGLMIAPPAGVRGRLPPKTAAAIVKFLQGNLLLPLSHAIDQRSKREIVVGCFLLSALIAISEYLDKVHLSMVLFYTIPISIVAWYAGRRSALLLTALNMPIWALAIVMKGSSYALTAFSLNRFFLFSLLGVVVAHIRHLHDNLEALAERRAQALVREVAERERLEREMLEISEREQRRIGRELHDGLCQHLTGTAMVSHVHARRLNKAEERDNAQRILQLIEQAIWLARGVAKGLCPIETQSDGLMQAFEEFSATTSELFKVSCRFECDLPVLVETQATAAHLFRIAQEAVSNAIKHGKATDILISLKHVESGLQLLVSDNGRGFLDSTSTPQNAGMGLRTMSTRAKLIGGEFSLRHNKAGGIDIVCSVPDQADA